jgi:hypothetical protein
MYIIANMGKRRKKAARAKTEKERKFKLIFDTPADGDTEDEDIYEVADSGMFLGTDDVQLIYNALREYTPTEEEQHLHSVLLEQLEETLVVNYGESYPNAN